MNAASKGWLLFFLNVVDAGLTLFWVRTGAATEGNTLMARLLEAGDAPFLAVKLTVAALVAYTLYRFSDIALARRGMSLVVGLYLLLMLVHAATGMSAAGLKAHESVIAFVAYLPDKLFSLLA